MAAIIFYLFKMIVCSGVMLLYYFLFLRNKRFHQFNRFYFFFPSPSALCCQACTFLLLCQEIRAVKIAIFKCLIW